MGKTKASQPAQAPTEEQIQIAAYLNWEKQTGGNPVDEETTKQFWLEAERQIIEPAKIAGYEEDK